MKPLIPIRRGLALLCVALCAVLVFAAPGALAGGIMPCRTPSVYSGAAVNLLVLPYRYTDHKAHGGDDSVGARLAGLVQQEALFSMLKYRSVGASQLLSPHGEVCDVNQVIDDVTRRGGAGGMKPGGGLAIIWGRIYEDGDDIYVQSYIRFLVMEASEQISVPMETAGGRLEFEASIPGYGMALAPRRMAAGDFREIAARAARNLVLHAEPDAKAPSRPYSRNPHEPSTYWVIDQRGDWMKITSQQTGETGWVHARLDDEEWNLRRFMPELTYLDAVVGYLRLRTGTSGADGERIRGWMRKGFAEYERAVGVDAAREAVALSRALQGQIAWGAPSRDARHAAAMFDETRQLIPESSAARNLGAVTAPLLRKESRLTREAVAEINNGLLAAIAVDGRNLQALRNLEKLYRYVKTQPALSKYSPEQIEERLALVKEAQQSAAQR